jgi:hypothetical protein
MIPLSNDINVHDRKTLIRKKKARPEVPDADAEGPTVGANCRGIVTVEVIGWLKSSG